MFYVLRDYSVKISKYQQTIKNIKHNFYQLEILNIILKYIIFIYFDIYYYQFYENIILNILFESIKL